MWRSWAGEQRKKVSQSMHWRIQILPTAHALPSPSSLRELMKILSGVERGVAGFQSRRPPASPARRLPPATAQGTSKGCLLAPLAGSNHGH